MDGHPRTSSLAVVALAATLVWVTFPAASVLGTLVLRLIRSGAGARLGHPDLDVLPAPGLRAEVADQFLAALAQGGAGLGRLRLDLDLQLIAVAVSFTSTLPRCSGSSCRVICCGSRRGPRRDRGSAAAPGPGSAGDRPGAAGRRPDGPAARMRGDRGDALLPPPRPPGGLRSRSPPPGHRPSDGVPAWRRVRWRRRRASGCSGRPRSRTRASRRPPGPSPVAPRAGPAAPRARVTTGRPSPAAGLSAGVAVEMTGLPAASVRARLGAAPVPSPTRSVGCRTRLPLDCPSGTSGLTPADQGEPDRWQAGWAGADGHLAGRGHHRQTRRSGRHRQRRGGCGGTADDQRRPGVRRRRRPRRSGAVACSSADQRRCRTCGSALAAAATAGPAWAPPSPLAPGPRGPAGLLRGHAGAAGASAASSAAKARKPGLAAAVHGRGGRRGFACTEQAGEIQLHQAPPCRLSRVLSWAASPASM